MHNSILEYDFTLHNTLFLFLNTSLRAFSLVCGFPAITPYACAYLCSALEQRKEVNAVWVDETTVRSAEPPLLLTGSTTLDVFRRQFDEVYLSCYKH